MLEKFLALRGMLGGSVNSDGGSSGSGEFKYTCGTITPVEKLFEIEHGLGEKPTCFMYYTEAKNMTGRVLEASSQLASNEQALKASDWDGHAYITRSVVILVGDEVYSFAAAGDWGYFTKLNLTDLHTIVSFYCDAEKFHGDVSNNANIIPFSRSGNVTIHWFALGR